MTVPENVEVGVLRWVPPKIQGLVRDLRVRWALEEAGWPYREHVIDGEEPKSTSYRALPPCGQLPAFRCDDVTLFESGAILLYIAERSVALMPAELTWRSEVGKWILRALNSVEPPILMLNILDMLSERPKDNGLKALRDWLVASIESRLDTLVPVMQGKQYVLGRFTAADVLLTTVLRILRDTDLVKCRPALKEYQRRCEARPAFQKALADHMANFAKHAPPRHP